MIRSLSGMALLCAVSFLSVSAFAADTFVFDKSSMAGLPPSQLPGFSSALSFTPASPNQNVSPNSDFTAGFVNTQFTSPGPATQPSNSNSATTPISFTVDYFLDGSSTPVAGTFNGDLVQNGWTKSIVTGQYFPNDYLVLNLNTVKGGEDIVPLQGTKYDLEMSTTPITLGKGASLCVTIVPAVSSAPEPATYGAMGLGLVGLAFLARRRVANKSKD